MPRQLHPRLRRGVGVLAPHMPVPATAVATNLDRQDRRPPSQRNMRQTPYDGVAGHPLQAALVTPVVGLQDPAGQHRMVVVDLLPGHRQAEAIQTSEGVEIRSRESSVEQVEGFRVDGVGTSIFGRPRPSPPHRRADSYTLICEEPS